MSGFRFTFLGTGTSVGVPMIGCACETCSSEDPRDQRLRCSILVETPELCLLVDAGPDLRQQCLREGISRLDGVLITHPHADHVMGLDDLRRFTAGRDDTLRVFARASCLSALEKMFFYVFNGQNRYPGYFKPDPCVLEKQLNIGDLEVVPIGVEHGNVECVGFLFRYAGSSVLAYLPDCKHIPQAAMEALRGVDCLVIDALRQRPHPTHMSIDEAVAISAELSPGETWLTHLSHDVLHAREQETLPAGVNIAHDGLKLSL
ncbi:MAG: MBL fold metallo-hydrolase [Verrucomicrobiaceae bacterium]|nr:MBL fold metallo-hydrolase [Verrucomicrobiaceae bacterium]